MQTYKAEQSSVEVLHDLPTQLAVLEAAKSTESLLLLGEQIVEYVDRRAPLSLNLEWNNRIRRDVANFKDLVEANAPSNSAAAELKITMLNPSITLDASYDTGEPTQAEVDGYALGTDSAKSVGYFFGCRPFSRRFGFGVSRADIRVRVSKFLVPLRRLGLFASCSPLM